MTTNNLPSIEELGFEALMQLREQIDARLESLRSEFMSQAAAMGIACSVDGAGKKRKRRAGAPKEID